MDEELKLQYEEAIWTAKALFQHGIICAKDTLLSAFGAIEEIEYSAKLSFLLTQEN